MLMESPKFRSCTLASVTSAIYHAGREGRHWVTDKEYGVPFLSSSDILKADHTHLPLLAKKQVQANPGFIVHKGWTLITRSGTIGRMAYVRPDMDGMACSEHAMRVVPEEDEISPGYLFAFLRSRYGMPMVIGGTYGSIIQSIEPEHIRNLPVPRQGKALETRVHQMVEEAAHLRARASSLLWIGIQELENEAGLPALPIPDAPYPYSVGYVSASFIQGRFDAFFHSVYHGDAAGAVRSSRVGAVCVYDLCESVVEPTRFKRTKVTDERYGVPFFGTSALFWSEPAPSYMIPRAQEDIEQYLVSRKSILVPRSGQLSGIIGRAVLPYGKIVGGAVTEDAIRVNCVDDEIAGFLFVALSSPFGLRQLKARAFGSSIPHLDVQSIGAVLVPDISSMARRRIGKRGAETAQLRGKAIALELEAVALVESAIEEAA